MLSSPPRSVLFSVALVGGILAGLLVCIDNRAAAASGDWALPYPPTQELSHVVFVAFDTETTGFSPSKDRIVELSAVRFTLEKNLAATNWLINPRRSIPQYVTAIHGIDDTMVAHAPSFGAVYPQFLELARGGILLAHNARFDVDFINAELRRAPAATEKLPVLDTWRIFRTWYPSAASYSLPFLIEYLRLPAQRFHRALDDAAYLADIFRHHYGEEKEYLAALVEAAGNRILWLGK